MRDPKTHFEQVPLEEIKKQIAQGTISEVVSEVSSESESQGTEDIEYPEWQNIFQEALLELNRERLKERVAAAEAAIARRLQSISQERDSEAERLALADALSSLRILKKESSGLTA
jgi:hypothetical protein